MNKTKRERLDTIAQKIHDIAVELEDVLNAEKKYRDNIPENLKESEEYELSDAACDYMKESIYKLEEAELLAIDAQE